MTTQLDCSLGLAKETAYGTGVTPTKFLEFTDESLDWSPTFTQGTGLRVGSRVARSKRRGQGKQMVAGDVTVEAASKGLGVLLQAALGAVTSTQRGTTGVFQHVFTPGNPVNSYTWQKGVPLYNGGAAQPQTFRGMVCSSLELDVSNSDIIQVKTSWNGKEFDTTTSYAPPSYPTPIELLEFSEASIVLGGTLTPPTATALASSSASAAANIIDLSLTYDNKLDDGGFNMGGGGKRVRPPEVGGGDDVIQGKLTAEYSDNTLRDAYASQADLALVLTAVGSSTIGTSDHPALQLIIPDIRLSGDLPKSNGGEPVTLEIDFTGFDDLSGNAPITLVYVSTDATP